MAAKLKSITKQIHWSLLVKAAVFALAWFYLPFWLFLLVALYLYFVPPFRAGKLAVFFFTLVILCFLAVPGWFMAFIFAALFYYLLLVKELLVIDRRSARILLAMTLSFLLLRQFYFSFSTGSAGSALMAAFFAAALLSLLLGNLIHNQVESFSDIPGLPTKLSDIAKFPRVVTLMAFVFFAQCIVIGLFLPLNFIYQSVIVFLVVVIAIDLIPERISGALSPAKIKTTSIVVFAMLVLVLTSAKWGM